MTFLILISIPIALLAILALITLPIAAKRGDNNLSTRSGVRECSGDVVAPLAARGPSYRPATLDNPTSRQGTL